MEPHLVKYHGPEDVTIVNWKVKTGSKVNQNTLLCRTQGLSSKRIYKLTSDCNGTIKTILCKEGEVVRDGDTIAQVERCYHPTVWRNMCAECGTYLKEKEICSASVAMEHTIPDLLISEKDAQTLGREVESRLLKNRQLVLLVDLDQTLIHTTNDNIPNNLKDVYHFQLPFGWPQDVRWYHTKFRPRTKEFLENMSKLFELHICTFGVRTYAHTIARFLDPDGKYFQQRILSRDECFHPTLKTSNLKALFPCGDSMVCIIDDRQDVWKNAPNLVHVKPYRFFDGTADINAPPEADKTKADSTNTDTGSSSRRPAKIVKVHRRKPDVNGTRQKESKVKPCDEKQHTGSGDEVESLRSTDDNGEDTVQEVSENGLKNDLDRLMVRDKPQSLESDASLFPETGDVPLLETNDAPVNTDPSIGNIYEETPEIQCSPDPISVSEDQTEEDRKEAQEFIEWEDLDDYLIYLEDILRRIHSAFYEMYDEIKNNATAPTPDLKTIVPYVRKKVLKGANILFSGVFPTNQAPETAHAYQLAVGLGATVHLSFVPPDSSKDASTTHLVAAKLGTEKMHSVSKFKDVKIVSPDWLWTCADRWEWVDERLFPLNEDTSKFFLSQGSPNPNTGQTSGSDRGATKTSTDKTFEVIYSREATKTSPETAAEIASKEKSDLETRDFERFQSSSAFKEMLQDVEEDLASSDEETENTLGEKEASEDSSENGDNFSEAESLLEERMLRDKVLRKRGWEDSSSEEESLSAELPKGWKKEDNREKRLKMEDSDLDEEDLPNSVNQNESSEDEDMQNSTSVDDDDSDKSFSACDEMADILERDYLS